MILLKSWLFKYPKKYLVAFLILILPLLSHAQFTGVYSSSNWVFTSQDLSGMQADGSIDLSNMPVGFTLTGNDDDLSGANSRYSINIPEDGTLKFKWSYETDDGPDYDRAGYILNGSFIELSDPSGSTTQSGETSVIVSKGDQFAFVVDATDACCGRGWITIDGFSTSDNTPPTLDAIPDIISPVNSGQIDLDLTGITAGILEPSQTVAISASSSNTSVIPNPTITYTSPDATGVLSFTPVTDAFGDAVITVNIQDDGGAVNGSVDNIDIVFKVSITSNFPPTIDQLSDADIAINEVLSLSLSGISAGDGESQTISISATSSDQSVVADGDINLIYTSPNTGGTLEITPIANASGQTTITVTVSDDGGTTNNGKNETSIDFILTVNPNNAPIINSINNLDLFINASNQIIDLSGIADGDPSVSQSLIISATSDNTALIPDPVVSYTSPNETGTLSFTPLADQFGKATITVTLTDNAGSSNGGSNETIRVFDVNVSGNFQPKIDALGNIVMGINEPIRTVNLSGISAGVLSNAETITVSAATNNSSVVNMSGVNVDYTDPNSTGTVTISPVTDAIGESTITVSVSDDGGTANGGKDKIDETFIVRVVANRTPELNELPDIGLDVNASEQIINLSGISSGETSDYQSLNVEVSSNNTALIPTPSVTYSSPNNTGTITFTPVTDATGIATITVTVTDDGGTLGGGQNSISKTFDISVTGNQPPTLDAIVDHSQRSFSNFSIDLSGISDGTGFSQNITVTATSDNPSIIPNPTVNYTNGDATGSLDFEPTGFGDAVITVTVMDDGGTNNGGVDIFVRTFNIHLGENTPPYFQDWDTSDDLDGQIYYLHNGQGEQAKLFAVDDDDDNIVSVTASGDNPALEDILSISYMPGSFIGGMIFNPISGQTGTVNFEISIMDDGGTANNGIDTRVSTITAVVTEPAIYSGTLSTDAFENHIQAFTLSQAGLVYINNLSGDIDAYFDLYIDSFDPTNPTVNRLGSGFELIAELSKDKQYILVTTNDSGDPGSFTNGIGVLDGIVSFGFLPNVDFISDIALDEDNTIVVPLTGVSDGNGNTNNLTLNALADEPSELSFNLTNNNDGTANLEIIPALNIHGVFDVTLTVTGSNGNTFDRSFEVTVNSVNDTPIVSNAILNQNYDLGFGSVEFDLSTVFSDVDVSDVLTYSATTTSTGVIEVSESSGILTITEVGLGETTVLLTASDGIAPAINTAFVVTVSKLSQTINFEALGEVTFGDTAFDLTATASSGLDVTFISSDINVATISGATVTIVGAGTTTITALQEGDDTYNVAFSIDQDLVVNQAEATVTLTDLVQVFDGTAKSPTVTTNPAGLSVNLKFDDNATVPSSTGTYTVVATIDDTNYSGSATEKFIIETETVTGLVNDLQTALNIFPNPAAEVIRIITNEPVASVSIYDLKGNKIVELLEYNSEEPVQIGDLKSGIYVVYIKTNTQTTHQKLVKQ
ncbi:MBG domain-containing protein [Flexithrix dorotheae]|uniref:MBG domain-containing protein n=1 Tax=Flexithrix dorotheae TaxID=70993 RepID=UPI00037EAD12|nr:MBG domain-containing protein [Flexithrix dorotheae]